MKITKEFLKEHNACDYGYEYWIKTDLPDLREFCLQALKDDYFDFINWLLVICLDHKNKIRYAVFAAKKVLNLYESKHPQDLRPRKAIEAAEKVLANDSVENRAAADSASDAAADAAAADAVCYAACSAASYASHATSAYYDITYSASILHASCAVIYSVDAYSAYSANPSLKTEIIMYGLSLIYKEDGK